MTQVFDAIYEHGTFRPLGAIGPGLTEGQQVRVTLEVDTPDDILTLAAKVYDGLTDTEIAAVEKIALDRSSFFARPDR
jgi:predicted DNA-binding antitoxin AbrB/MazE fold protein